MKSRCSRNCSAGKYPDDQHLHAILRPEVLAATLILTKLSN